MWKEGQPYQQEQPGVTYYKPWYPETEQPITPQEDPRAEKEYIDYGTGKQTEELYFNDEGVDYATKKD